MECPSGVKQVECLKDPCLGSTCPFHPNATCKPNFCGGCNADYVINEVDVTKTCNTGKKTELLYNYKHYRHW